ncbi:MAG: cytochrome c-type biogenesis protein CcmH [Gammaproteobacteria bacterium]|nr:cytochrome c-type biogenesis protein CcmH [Gammaproteobacteria bacterium]
MRWIVCLLGSLVLAASVSAAIETYTFDSPEQEARFRQLGFELRCPKCQNQAIGDSDAPISKDLRAEVHRMLLEGATDQEIKAFMVARYGRYVLYRPPLDRQTLFLWAGPGLFLIIGIGLVAYRIRLSKRAMTQEISS